MYFNSKAKEQRWVFWQVSQKREDISICLSLVHLFSKMIFLCVFLSETLRPCPHYTVFKRKRHCFVLDTANVPQYNAENDQRKRINSKTLSRGVRRKRCYLKTMTSQQMNWPLQPWVSKIADRRFHGWLPCWSLWFFSLLTLLKAHLTLLRLFDFSRRETKYCKAS